MGMNVNVRSNLGALSFRNLEIFGSGLPSFPNLTTFNIFENSGTLNLNLTELPIDGTPVNVLGNMGTINIDNFLGTGTPGVKLRLGDSGSLADVHGTVHLSGLRRIFDVALDDRNNPAAGRQWTIDGLHASVGDLTVFFPTDGGGLGGLAWKFVPMPAVRSRSQVSSMARGRSMSSVPALAIRWLVPRWRVQRIGASTAPTRV